MKNISLNKFASMQASIGYVKVLPTMQFWTGIHRKAHLSIKVYAIIDWRCLRIPIAHWWIPKDWILNLVWDNVFWQITIAWLSNKYYSEWCLDNHSVANQPSQRMGCLTSLNFSLKRLLKIISWFASRPASPRTMGGGGNRVLGKNED